MPRRPRLEAPGAVHHVVAQSASDGRIVVDDADRLRFLDELRRVIQEYSWECVAYCVMTTHIHLIISTPTPNLGEGMGTLLGRYAFAFNRRHGRKGHVFRNRFWSRRIDRPHYLTCSAFYAVLNPVAAGLCTHPGGFPWSSYLETVGAVPESGFLSPGLLLSTLDDDVAVAREKCRELIDEAVVRLRTRRAEEAWWRTVERAAAETLATG